MNSGFVQPSSAAKFLFPVILLIMGSFSDLYCQFMTFDERIHEESMITVKFADELYLVFENGKFSSLSRQLFSLDLQEKMDEFEWSSPFSVCRDKLLDKWIALNRKRQDSRATNVANRFNLRIKESLITDEILDFFRSLDEVEYAWPIPKAVELPLAPDFEENQGYLNSSPAGIDARYAWDFQTVRGRGIKIVDIEYNFNPDHRDLPDVVVLGGTPYDGFGDNHGTAVLGQMGALDNGWGVTGMAPDAEYYFHYAFSDQNFLDYGAAVVNSAMAIEAGDIILIEAQTRGPNYDPDAGGQFGLVPVEWFQPWYDGIVFAVEMGRIVVAAGGNGSQDLDDPIYDRPFHAPFLPENNSGSIIVGAGAAPLEFNGTSAARSRLSFSNFGSRINLQGWGQRIYTTGYGTAYNSSGPNLHFANSFGGTSGASPIVTAAMALIQSASKTFYGITMTGEEIFTLLDSTGLPQTSGQNPVSENIGPLPDLRAAFLAMDLEPCESPGENFVRQQEIICFGGDDGMLTVDSQLINISDFLIYWSTGDTSLQLTSLGAGEYSVYLADSTGCIFTKKINLEQPEQLSIDFVQVAETCLGSNDGLVTLHPRGGSGPYQLLVDGELLNSHSINLPPGIYFVEVVDTADCTIELELEVEEGPELSAFIIGPDLAFVDSLSAFEMVSDDDFDYINWSIFNGQIVNGQGTDRVEISWNLPGEKVVFVEAGIGERCIAFDEFATLVEQISSSNERKPEQEIALYPNPFNRELHIRIAGNEGQEGISYRIYSIDGRLMESNELNNATLTLNGPPGIYMVELLDNDRVLMRKRVAKSFP